MSERLSRELGAVLDRYDSALRAAELRAQQVRHEGEIFLERFAEVVRSVILPVFEAAGGILRQRGHDFRIARDGFAADGSGEAAEASIQLSIARAGPDRAPDDDRSRLTFSTRHYSRMVSIRNGAAPHEGSAGAKGVYSLEAIDQQMVEEEVLRLMTALVKG